MWMNSVSVPVGTVHKDIRPNYGSITELLVRVFVGSRGTQFVRYFI